MTYIRVDLDALDNLASDLDTLYSDFDGVPNAADRVNDSIGSSVVQDAVSNFASNWKVRRDHLLTSIDSVRKMAKEAHTSFTDADQKLADTVLGKK